MAKPAKIKTNRASTRALNMMSLHSAMGDLHFTQMQAANVASQGGRYSHFEDAADDHANQANKHDLEQNRIGIMLRGKGGNAESLRPNMSRRHKTSRVN